MKGKLLKRKVKKPLLSIIIPVYEEEKLIGEVLKRVGKLKIKKEIIVVDDASRDKTVEVVREEAKKNAEIKILLSPDHIGKGMAIRKGLKEAKGEIIIIQDADLEYQPEEIPQVIRPILKKETKVCYGSRFLGKIENMRFLNWLANKFFVLVIRILYGARITDEATAYKAFRRELIEGMEFECQGFEFCPEITARFLRKGYSIKEVPVSFTARSREEGKKIGWKDGIICLWTLLKWRFKKP